MGRINPPTYNGPRARSATPPRAAAARAAAAAAQAAEEAAAASRFAADHAAYIAAEAARHATQAANDAARPFAATFARRAEHGGAVDADGPVRPTSTGPVVWPPPPGDQGHRFWLARGFHFLEDGIYTATALRNRDVDPDVAHATGLLQGWKTAEPTLRRSAETGADSTIVHWR